MALIDITYIKSRIRFRALKELTDDAEDPQGRIIDSKLQTVIDDVQARVNNVLRKNYTIPLEQLGDKASEYADSIITIKNLCVRCVMHDLYTGAGIEIPEPYRNAFVDLDTFETGESKLHGVKSKAKLGIASSRNVTDKIYSPELLAKI
jgi:hypothetical protein